MATDLIDDLNHAIIAALQENPSRTNKDIGSKLGVSEPTVATRIRALEDAKVLRIMMQSDMRAMGLPLLSLLDVHVEGRPPEDVAAELAALDECTSVSLPMSNPDVFCNINSADGPDLQRFVDEHLSKIEGIVSYEISTALEVVKLDPRFGKLRD